jgi:Dolichyl-phosphate-mannose-protein mannosyltransferase
MTRRLAEAAVVFLGLVGVYLANGRTIATEDTLPARYLPLAILRDATFHLDAFPFLFDDRAPGGRIGGLPYYIVRANGHYVSWYPVGAALMALPIYLPAVLLGISPESPGMAQQEKVAAAIIVALSAVILYLALLRLTSRRVAVAIVAVYGLGTSSLSVSSQALWQHGPSQLALAATLYCLLRGRTEAGWVALAGFPLSFAVLTRPPDILLALPLLVYVLRYHLPQAPGFVLAGVPCGLFQLWYNTVYFGRPLHTQLPLFEPSLWPTPLWEGLTGVLLSPGRGLLVYSPVFVFSAVGIACAWRRGGDPLLRALSVGVVLTILVYGKWAKWWGGWTYGPRLLADLTPLLAVCLVPLATTVLRARAWQAAFLALAIWSIGAHAIGAFRDDLAWNRRVDVEAHPERLWRWSDNQLVNPLRHMLRPDG